MDLIGEILFTLGGYWTARMLVPVLTIGRVQVERFSGSPRGKSARSKARTESPKPNALGVYRFDGQLYLNGEAAAFLGFAFWVLVALTTAVMWSRL